jgi:hypothetical protein
MAPSLTRGVEQLFVFWCCFFSRGKPVAALFEEMTATINIRPNEDADGGTADSRARYQDCHSEMTAKKFITVW